MILNIIISIFISIIISFLICINYSKIINKYFYLYLIVLSIFIYYLINYLINKINKINKIKIYENLEMNNKSNTKSFTIPGVNLNDYGNINLNLGYNSQKSTNKVTNDKKYINENDINNENIQDDYDYNNIIPKKFNKKSIYGIYAWTNDPYFYIPSTDGIH